MHARTFTLAGRLLPSAKRRATNALYAFCRIADDLADQPYANPDTLRIELAGYRARLENTLKGTPDDAVFRELALAIRSFSLPTAPLYELLSGVERDLDPVEFENWSQLEAYCQGVASSVGELCTHVFGTRSSGEHEPTMKHAIVYARTLGVAMQLTNILRDIGEDARLGRCYLPTDELEAFGLDREDLLRNPWKCLSAPGWMAFMRSQVDRARSLYKAARPGIALLSVDTQRCALACADGYAAILEAIEKRQYNTISGRAVVSMPRRLRLLWSAWRYQPVHGDERAGLSSRSGTTSSLHAPVAPRDDSYRIGLR